MASCARTKSQITNHGGTPGELIIRLTESSLFGGPHADAAAWRKAPAGQTSIAQPGIGGRRKLEFAVFE